MGNYLITGCAGFIGSHLCRKLLWQGHEVIGIDNLNDYYPPEIKEYRLSLLMEQPRFDYMRVDILKPGTLPNIIDNYHFDTIFHLAAMPGVRLSIEQPQLYVRNNIQASISLLEAAVKAGVEKVIMASSSSVYGDWGQPTKGHDLMTSSETYPTGYPLSPYAMTKRSMELLAYTYHALYGINITLPRYFTVYGPAGRPDMAYFKFVRAFMKGESIEVYGDGEQLRDMTYIDDVVNATITMDRLQGYNIINVGSGNPLTLNRMIRIIIDKMGIENPEIIYTDKQAGDVRVTYACISRAKELLDWEPEWDIEEGIEKTVEWFKSDYRLTGLE